MEEKILIGDGGSRTREAELRWHGLRVNQESNIVWRGERELALTDTEWRILRLLLKNRGTVFSMAKIYESVWEEPYLAASSNTIMVHIRRLREKIEDDPCHPEFIRTVWGKGYRVG